MPIPPPARKVRFDVRPWGDGPDPARELLPYVDNVSLVDLISGYERAAGYDVPGTYAGIVLDHFNFGDLTAYLAGEPHGFAQPFRPERDYGTFGPFVFRRSQYERASREATAIASIFEEHG